MTRARDLANFGSTTADVTDLNYAKTLYDTGVTGAEFDYLDGVTSALQTQINNAGATGGISDGNHLEANANVADNDFLRVDGTEIEGRSAAEVLSDISAIGASNPTVTLGSNATFPAGHILDVVSLATDAATTAGNTDWVLTGLDLSITPSASSSTILVFISSNMGGVDGSPRIKMTRTPSGGSEADVNVNSTTGDPVGMIADARLSNVQLGAPTQMYFEDSPSATVSVRYRVYIRSAETKNVYFGRSGYSSSPDGEYRVKSNMILMEVSG